MINRVVLAGTVEQQATELKGGGCEFTLRVGREGEEEQVPCRIEGKRGDALRQHLPAGKRVSVVGTLSRGVACVGPYDSFEFLGGE